MLRPPCRLLLRCVAAALSALALSGAAAAQGEIPVLSGTVYPGDIITADMVLLRPRPPGLTGVVTDPQQLVGMTVRRTLLPNQPVPAFAVAAPRVIERGKPARLVFTDGGITIETLVEPLQPGGRGDVVRARNLDTGVTVTGIVQADGTLRAGALR